MGLGYCYVFPKWNAGHLDGLDLPISAAPQDCSGYETETSSGRLPCVGPEPRSATPTAAPTR